MLDANIFGDVEPNQKASPNRIRFKPAKTLERKKGAPKSEPEKFQVSAPKNLKPVSKTSNGAANLFDSKLAVGNIVKHIRFGKGEVLKIEGQGADTKAEIRFETGGSKKLLLRFAKLEVIG